jgi:uncharacterized protein (TIGR02284 family)
MPDMNHRYTIETLRELIAVRREGEQGFRACAEHAGSEELRDVLMAHAHECARAVEGLQALVRQLGGDPRLRATSPRATRRGWLNPRSTLARNEDGAILDDCERGASRILEVYRNALDDPLPDFVRRVVLRQFEAVMSDHDQIRDLRNERQLRETLPTSTPGAQAGQH